MDNKIDSEATECRVCGGIVGCGESLCAGCIQYKKKADEHKATLREAARKDRIRMARIHEFGPASSVDYALHPVITRLTEEV